MVNKVVTKDLEQRHEFKDKIKAKVSNTLAPECGTEEVLNTVDVEVPSNFYELSDVQLFGALKYQNLTPEQATNALEQLRGRMEKTGEFRTLLQAPVQKLQEPVEEAIVTPIVVTVDLPDDFRTYRTKDQYLYLTAECALAPEQANDIVDLLQGKAVDCSYDLRFFEKAEVPSLEPPFKAPLAPLSLTLPHDFTDSKYVYQEMALTKDYGLSLAEARDVLAVLANNPTDRQVTIEFEEPPVVVAPAEEPFPELSIEVPARFSSLAPYDQFLFLKGQRNLTTDQANDVIAAVNGQSPTTYKVMLQVQDPMRITAPSKADTPPPINLTLPYDFSTFRRVYQEIILEKDYGLSFRDTKDVLAAFDGRPVNREVNITMEEPPPVVEAPLVAEIYPELTVELPASFVALSPQERFNYLKTERRLTSDEANDVLMAFVGRTPTYNKVTLTVLEQEVQPDAPGAEPAAPLHVVLPHDFHTLKHLYQEMMLTKDLGLSLKDARDVLAVANGKNVGREINIELEPAPPAPPPLPPKESFPEITVELPETFQTLTPHNQYLYLKTETHLTSEQANDVLAVLDGKAPIFSKVTIL